MTPHAQDIPSRVSTPFKRASKVRLPGRGRFTSVLLAIGTIMLVLAAGVLVVVVYNQTTEKDSPTATEAQPGEMMRPMVDMNAKP